MQKTCSKCVSQVYDPFGGKMIIHDELNCRGIRTGFAIVEPIPNIKDAKIIYTETDNLPSISLPKEVRKLKEIVDDINKKEIYFTKTTT